VDAEANVPASQEETAISLNALFCTIKTKAPETFLEGH
jgi:hypothetical protein